MASHYVEMRYLVILQSESKNCNLSFKRYQSKLIPASLSQPQQNHLFHSFPFTWMSTKFTLQSPLRQRRLSTQSPMRKLTKLPQRSTLDFILSALTPHRDMKAVLYKADSRRSINLPVLSGSAFHHAASI